MIYIIIAIIALLVINLILSIYILKKLDEAKSDHRFITTVLEEFCSINKKTYDVIFEINNEMDRMANRFDDLYEDLTDLTRAINQSTLSIVANQHEIVETLQTVESYMDISKNTLTEICDKLKKPEIDIVPVAKAYNMLAVAFDPETIPEVDWEPLIKKAMTHLGVFLDNNVEE